MAQVQLYAKRQDSTSDYINLELFDSEPIKLTLSVTNIEDPLAATSIYSKTFRVPHTSVNGTFFEGAFNVNSIDFDASKKADAYILDNGMLFTTGNIVLNGIYVNEASKNIEYEITFLGQTSDFGAKIGGGFLSDLNLNQYNHDRTYKSIVQSWTNGLYNGDITYGLIEWGYNYNANNQPVQPTISNGFENSFTSNLHPLRIQQWKPQIRAKALWDTIFNESGYTYDSVFLDSPLFKNMYVISDSKAQAELGTENVFSARSKAEISIPGGDSILINCPDDVSDPGNNYKISVDPITGKGFSVYTAPSTGAYNFEFGSRILTDSRESYQVKGSFIIFDVATGDVIGNKIWNLTTPQQLTDIVITCQLEVDQEVYFVLDINWIRLDNVVVTDVILNLINARLQCTEAPTIMSIASMMPNNIRKIDYMRSIINRFRLVFVPSNDIPNHFTITPWKDWILQGKSVDWSNKLDTSKDLKITPLFYGQSRFQVYKDEEDADYLNYNYQLVYKQTIGQLNLDSNNELIKGEKIYQDKFAPTPIAPIGFKEGDLAGSRFLIPHMAKDSGSSTDTEGTSIIVGKREPIQPKLRLVFYNGLQAAPIPWWLAITLTGDVGEQQLSYPLMSQYASWPVTNSTFDLNWENETPQWDATDVLLGDAKTSFSSFNVYWKTWYDLMFDPYSRIIEANVVIDYNDVLDIKFNDYIFIKDAWYFVNKISDYIAGKNTNCKVELVKIGNNIGITLPIVTPTSLTPISLCVASTVCDAFCCNPNVINSTPGEYFINAPVLANATLLYVDSQGSIYAPEGIYSNGVVAFSVNSSGVIIEFLDTASCVCTQTAYNYTTQYSNTACKACCGGSTVVVYSNNVVFTDSRYLYLDIIFTIPAPAGYYSLGGEVVEVSSTGQILTISQCSLCECTPLYPYYPCYDTTICEVCCCPETPAIWGNASTWEANTVLYASNAGVTPALEGFYKLNDTILTVNSLGDVTSDAATCTSCDPCPDGPIEVTVNLEQVTTGYNSLATLQYSYNDISWMDVGTVEIISTDPANTSKSTIFYVNDNVYLRTIFNSDVDQGILTTSYTINDVEIPDISINTPSSRTVIIPGKTIFSSSYEFTAIISGGTAPCEPNIIVGGQYTLYNSAGFPTGGVIKSILQLNNDASVNTNFNVSGGLRITGYTTGNVQSIKKIGNKILVGGQFGIYNDIDCTNGVLLFNEDGTLDANFNSRVGVNGVFDIVYSAVENNGIVYIAGNFTLWNQAPLGSTTPNTSGGISLVALNLSNGLRASGFTSPFDPARYTSTIWVTKVYENKIYVGGDLSGIIGDSTKKYLYRLNLDGSYDNTFNAQHLLTDVYDIAFDGDYIWVVCANINNNSIAKLNKSNGSLVTWGPTTKFNGTVRKIIIKDSLIYVGGDFTTYNSVTYKSPLALNKNDGTVYTTFNSGTGLSNIRGIAITDTHLYCTGIFTSYNGTPINRFAKINLTNGSLDTSFNIGTGFNNGTFGIELIPCPVITPTLYEIGTSFGSNTCDAWCETDRFSIYGNGTTLIQSTQLFSNIGGTEYPTIGYYSDGSTVVNVGANGIIIEIMNTSSCQCPTTTLYEFNTKYDVDVICEAVCIGVATKIYLNQPSISSASIAYTDMSGTTQSPAGYYVYFLKVITVGAYGVITSVADIPTTCGCATEECAIYEIRNLDAAAINSTWVDCTGLYVKPNNTIPSGGAILTSCTLPSNISATGNTSISYYSVCPAPVAYYITLGVADCQVEGPCDSSGDICEVHIPILNNCPVGSTVSLTVTSSSYSTSDAFYDSFTGSWYVAYRQTGPLIPGGKVTSYADIRLDISSGSMLLATSTSRISYRASWETLDPCVI